ncbi:MAG: class I adenylate-forming enzyme family protein [Halioglobus sp.]|nr:class I adenylate-forming enzyme family protein [Halioglobus sp.]
MSVCSVSDFLDRYSDRQFLSDVAGSLSYRQVAQRCHVIANRLDSFGVKRVACYMPDSIALVSIMLGAAVGGQSILVLNSEFSHDKVAALLKRFEIDLLVTDGNYGREFSGQIVRSDELCEDELDFATHECASGEVLVLTSGTTGDPKCARYQWGDLLAQVATPVERRAEKWLLAYRLNHFAGLQMLSHVLVHGGQLVVPASSKVVDAIRAIRDHGVTHVSATPTFWRYALVNIGRNDPKIQLEQITLGSEPVTADILDKLQKQFPAARVVHIYASTEAGSCVSVSDMRPGMPASILSRDGASTTQFKIHEEELYIKSSHGMRGYLDAGELASKKEDGWLATGDLVKLEGDRIIFLGRRTETINVGGTKVHPLEIEAKISALPSVKLVRVYGKENPVVGEIVAVDIVPHQNIPEVEIEGAVREACKDFSRTMQPRLINIVSAIETKNQKVARG